MPELIAPFYHRGKLCYHLALASGLEEGKWELISNIPKQIFEQYDKEIVGLGRRQFDEQLSKIDYLHKIAKIIEKDIRAKHFYYPSYLLFNGCDMLESTFLKFSNIADGFILHPGKYFSRNHEQLRFYILNRKFYILKYFFREVFEEAIIPCSRQEFEQSLVSENSQSEYVELYAANNLFYRVEEEDAQVFILMSKSKLQMIALTE